MKKTTNEEEKSEDKNGVKKRNSRDGDREEMKKRRKKKKQNDRNKETKRVKQGRDRLIHVCNVMGEAERTKEGMNETERKKSFENLSCATKNVSMYKGHDL